MSARLAVRVQPRARRPGLKGWRADGALGIAVAAPPEGGRANAEVAELLAERLGIGTRAVRVVRGHASRSKWVEIDGLEEATLRGRIDAALNERRGDDGE